MKLYNAINFKSNGIYKKWQRLSVSSVVNARDKQLRLYSFTSRGVCNANKHTEL